MQSDARLQIEISVQHTVKARRVWVNYRAQRERKLTELMKMSAQKKPTGFIEAAGGFLIARRRAPGTDPLSFSPCAETTAN